MDYANGQIVPQGDDGRLLVKFYKQAVKNEFRSSQEGRPIFDEHDFISIIVPGDKTMKVDRKVRPEDKERFAPQWARYQNNEQVPLSGTPIDEWPRVSVSQAAELKAMNLFTVEHLAGIADTVCQKMMGLDQLRTEARAYLAAAKDASHAQHLAAELEKRDADIAALKDTIATMAAKLDALTEKPKRERAAA